MRLKLLTRFLTLSLPVFFFSCKDKSSPATAATIKEETPEKPPASEKLKDLSKGKGSLSFKIDGRLYETDPERTKCWTVENMPGAMLTAHGEELKVSWQIKYSADNNSYHIDRDNKGGASFTIGDKRYGIRSRAGDNYLDILFTDVKDKFSVKLLSGTFEGVLEDEKGNKIQITEGKFQTDDI